MQEGDLPPRALVDEPVLVGVQVDVEHLLVELEVVIETLPQPHLEGLPELLPPDVGEETHLDLLPIVHVAPLPHLYNNYQRPLKLTTGYNSYIDEAHPSQL